MFHVRDTHMTQLTVENLPPMRLTLDALMDRHGIWHVLGATFVAALRAPKLRRDMNAMSDHMRRDIGLPPRDRPERIRELLR